MPKALYPTDKDLAQYLAAFGVVPDDTTMQLLSPASKASAAWQAWERVTGWRPYLSTGGPVTRTFDPLWQGGVLELPAGLLTLGSVTTGVVNGQGGTLRAVGIDFRLLPLNAEADALPYTLLQWGAGGYFAYEVSQGFSGVGHGVGGIGGFFDPFFWGEAGQIAVSGVWGRTLALDDDDWDAILQYAAYLCVPQIALMVSKGLYSARDLNFEIRYGGGKETPLSGQAEMWKANFDAKAALRRKIRVT